jgi:hypothetical protein
MEKKTKIILGASIIVIALAIILLFFGLSDKSENFCNSSSVEECSDECVVCPPCEVCSSISCQTEEFCKDIGFNRSWYEDTVVIGDSSTR